MPIKSNHPGLRANLDAQVDKVAQHNRQGSYQTQGRYHEGNKRFSAFLADKFHLQKLANISGKHLAAYVEYMQAKGLSASTIKTDLAAIRFYHDKMERTKYRLPSNDELAVELERRRFGGVDRTWSQREFSLFLTTCMEDDHEDYAAVACLTWYAGLRIHECFASTPPLRHRPFGTMPLLLKVRAASSAPYPSTKASALSSRSC